MTESNFFSSQDYLDLNTSNKTEHLKLDNSAISYTIINNVAYCPYQSTFAQFTGEINLKDIKQDVIMMAGVTDHITPWRACYRNTQFFGGNVQFILSNSGHIQSLLNPPGNPKAKFFTNKKNPESSDDWLASAEENVGSWWPYWGKWLKKRSGDMKNTPRKLGNKSHPPTVKAPGEYVFT